MCILQFQAGRVVSKYIVKFSKMDLHKELEKKKEKYGPYKIEPFQPSQ